MSDVPWAPMKSQSDGEKVILARCTDIYIQKYGLVILTWGEFEVSFFKTVPRRILKEVRTADLVLFG